VHLLAGGTTSFAFNPATQGLLVVNDLRRMVWSYHGVMPGAGTLVSSLAVPALPATVDTRTRFLQAAMIHSGGRIMLGSPACLVIIGAGF